MARFVPVKITKMEELEAAVKSNSAVILIDNTNIAKKVQEISDHDVVLQNKASKAMKVGGGAAGTSIGLLVLGAIGESFFAPIGVICGLGFLASAVVSVYSLAWGTGRKIFNAIATQLKDYKWFEQNKKTILYKYRGKNSFDPDNDELEAYNG